MSNVKNNQIVQHILLAAICGVLSTIVDFYVIPLVLKNGTADAIWIALMFLLPIVLALLFMKVVARCNPVTVWCGAIVQIIIVSFGARTLGPINGFQLGKIEWDLFDWIAYVIYTYGWIIAVTVAQWSVLYCLKYYSKRRNS